MKNTRNQYEFMSAVLDVLGVDYEEADIKNREVWRSKVLDGWGVSYMTDDLKQFERWRKKCLEGLGKGSGGSCPYKIIKGTFTNIDESAQLDISFTFNNTYYRTQYIEAQTTAEIWIPVIGDSTVIGVAKFTNVTGDAEVDEETHNLIATGDFTASIEPRLA